MRKKEREMLETQRNIYLAVLRYILPILIAVIIFLGFKLFESTYTLKDINLDKYVALVGGEKDSLVFITGDHCDTCDSTKELLEKLFEGSKIRTYELNISTLSNAEKETMMNTLEETKEGVTAPALLVVSKNKLNYGFYGPFDEDLVIQFLQDASLVRKISNEGND